MDTHPFKRVEITDKKEQCACVFDYAYMVRGRAEILERTIERVIAELNNKGIEVKEKDLKGFIIEGRKSNGYFSPYAILDKAGVYEETVRREVTLAFLRKEIASYGTKE